MQVLLHADSHTDGSQPMTEHLRAVVQAALGRYGERVTRVEAYLCDINSPVRSGSDDIHCTLEARLVGGHAVIVKDHAGNAHQAIEGAMRKLQRAVGVVMAKQDPRGGRHAAAAPDPEVDADRPA